MATSLDISQKLDRVSIDLLLAVDSTAAGLGVTYCIIGAFAQLEASGGQLTTGLMAEIGEALIATAVGLLVALPAVAAYNAFQRGIQIRLNRADALGRELVANLHAVAQRARDARSARLVPAPGGE